MFVWVAIALAASCLCNVASGAKPNIVLILVGCSRLACLKKSNFAVFEWWLSTQVDDFGWANVGYHRDSGTEEAKEAATPNLDQLAKVEGVELDRHYTYKICSPSRCSLQTGCSDPFFLVAHGISKELHPRRSVGCPR